jgi:hypothetical protein
MANNKTGLNYYNIDTDRYMDIKIKRLKKDFGCSGIAVYDYILCEIYRVKGCFIAWDESTAFDVAEYFGLKENLVMEIVTYCGVVGLFDRELLTGGKILTSKSIQSRYIEMCNRAKRNNVIIPDFCNIIREESHIIREESHIIPEVCRKVKESKVKESKEGGNARERAPSPKNLEERKEIFLNECAGYVEKYTKEMVRNFFDYWTEPDKSHSKMRFELEKTWDFGKRLSTWDRNEFKFNKNGTNRIAEIGNGGILGGDNQGNRKNTFRDNAENRRNERQMLVNMAETVLQQP